MRHRSTITIEKDKETLIRESLCREESVRLHRIAEAEIVGVAPLEEPKLPVYPREKVKWSEMILSAINIRQFLP